MTYFKSFKAFAETDLGKKVLDPEFRDRLERSEERIETSTGLTNFARARWPEDYEGNYRDDKGGQRGRKAMKKVWSTYLLWRETAPSVVPMPSSSKAKSSA